MLHPFINAAKILYALRVTHCRTGHYGTIRDPKVIGSSPITSAISFQCVIGFRGSCAFVLWPLARKRQVPPLPLVVIVALAASATVRVPLEQLHLLLVLVNELIITIFVPLHLGVSKEGCE